ncbi:IreB family regulatory phosphoprotein [Gemelliphila palaticanis]|uniref:IreB family regulatory phosphoprotein n=1 Tax=Gemelliphila palaticanis TaxID=81950 RepID=A0ABX2SZM6_9BACL|nr:IreB family regulatory phosphoprotein [Gemella palaticanis]MBF0715612.1 IreB family regulatory phosphoprotein [Gemella palaticanis]NYS47542.1 IreB family regulatory phosphoprotein [Gemella palaticanis]
MSNFNTTDIFDTKELNREYIKETLKIVVAAISNKNYDPISQILGYIKTNNPVYIPRDNKARERIMNINKDELLEYLLYYFIEENKCLEKE